VAEHKLKGLGVPEGRKLETEEERSERFKRNAEKLHDAGVAEEDALDAMVRRSISPWPLKFALFDFRTPSHFARSSKRPSMEGI
jgi:hypothetical protein